MENTLEPVTEFCKIALKKNILVSAAYIDISFYYRLFAFIHLI